MLPPFEALSEDENVRCASMSAGWVPLTVGSQRKVGPVWEQLFPRTVCNYICRKVWWARINESHCARWSSVPFDDRCNLSENGSIRLYARVMMLELMRVYAFAQTILLMDATGSFSWLFFPSLSKLLSVLKQCTLHNIVYHWYGGSDWSDIQAKKRSVFTTTGLCIQHLQPLVPLLHWKVPYSLHVFEPVREQCTVGCVQRQVFSGQGQLCRVWVLHSC